jgi:glycosyltransferase involved in cell wall biosynthesis
MRILQISSAKNYGGGEKHFVDLCRGLREKGHDIFVVLRRENTWKNKLDFLPRANIIYLPLRNSLDIFSARNLSQIMREKDIAIIHAHLARDYPIAGLAARLYQKAKFIISRHVLFPMKSIHKITLTNVSKVIAISEPTERQIKKIFPVEKIALIPYGIEIEDFSEKETERLCADFRSTHNIPADALLIGTVGELSPLKGQREFILAAEIIRKTFPAVRFLSSGKDQSYGQNHRRELKRLVRILDLEENFIWLDWVEDMNSLYAALDIFVSASHTESFGLAIAEAMASGTAVISTTTEGAKQLITDNLTGKFVPIDEPVKLAEAITEVLKDKEKRELFEQKAREFALENFSLEKMISATEKLYQSVLA